MIIKTLAAFLVVVSAYLGWWAVSSAVLLWLLPSVVALVAAVGLLLHKSWAPYLWYAIALTASLLWLVSVVREAFSGWPHERLLDSAISLLPGLFLVTVCAFGSLAVFRSFRGGTSAL